MKIESTFLVLYLAAAFAALVFLSGCNPFDLEGSPAPNIAPTVEWAQIPQDSTQHSSNPELKWIGKDKDGQIAALDYRYVVVLEEEVDAAGGPATMAADFPVDYEWTSLGNVTKAVIPLYASEDTSIYVDQYVFLRALDDQGMYSNIIYLFLSRNNHPPTCVIFVPEGPQWCLPDTSEYWHGIGVTWEGKDSLDYEGIQPDFLWEIRVYGPYGTVPDSTDTLPQYYLGNIVDPETGEWQVPYEAWTFTDLETGWYIVYVRNFDDASVPAIPALGFLEIFEPNWIRHPDDTKDVLIVNHSTFTPVPGNLSSDWADSVRIFYENLMADAGFTTDQWDWSDVTVQPHSTLYNYRLVLVDDVDWSGPITENPEAAYADYLNVGGMIMVNGRFSFANVSNQGGVVEYGPNDAHPLAFTYMDFSSTIYPPTDFSFSEFVGANAIEGTGFPSFVRVDTMKIQALSGSYTTALPRVERIVRQLNSETIFKFVSSNPDSVGTFHGFPVATRRDNGIFKTSYFSFPFFFLPYSQASTVFNDMMTWYLDE
jgi:hypothetical protein